MTTTNNADVESNPDALYRYQVVSMVLCREQTGEPRSVAVDAVADVAHRTPDGALKRASVRSVYRWLASYEKIGFAGLLPKQREKITDSLVLPTAFLEFCKEEKRKDPITSIPELIDRARLKGIISFTQPINRTTLWRALNRMGIDTSRRKQSARNDKRRFAFSNRMEMVLCDGKHFRAGNGRLKRVAFFFIDDATRAILGVVVGTSESAELFLRGVHKVIERHGLMTRLYVDNGSGFKANDATSILANLGVAYIRGTVGYPQGRGKVERFNRTVQDRVLRHLQSPEVDPDLLSLELRLDHYCTHIYNQTSHESLHGTTPWQCFLVDEHPLRFPENRQVLEEKFVLHTTRRVSDDNIVKLDGEQYEIMHGYAGAHVQLRRNLLDNSISIVHNGKVVRLALVDQNANARRPTTTPKQDANTDCTDVSSECAANIAHNKDYEPIVDPDGGFSKENTQKK